jgi:hypothetical protein
VYFAFTYCKSLLVGIHQLPFLLGVPVLEKIAAPIAPFVVGRTGKQLFLTDGKSSDPPLLLRMASDGGEGLFMYVPFQDFTYLQSIQHFFVTLQMWRYKFISFLPFLEE